MTNPTPRTVHDLTCADCGARMYLRNGSFGQFYGCSRYPACNGSHGCHDDGTPMGTPATAEVRKARRHAHAAFDPLWRDDGLMTRSQAYAWLARTLGVAADACHIGMFDADTCARVVNAVARFKRVEWVPRDVPRKVRGRLCLLLTRAGYDLHGWDGASVPACTVEVIDWLLTLPPRVRVSDDGLMRLLRRVRVDLLTLETIRLADGPARHDMLLALSGGDVG